MLIASGHQRRVGWLFRASHVVPVSLAPLLACAAPGTQSLSQQLAADTTCYISGVPRAARCVSLEVPVDWSKRHGKRLRISAVVIAATRRAAQDPLFVFPGGPGQGASGYGALVVSAFAEVNRSRDLVLVDPRGTGRSTPFHCDLGNAALATPSPSERRKLGRACAAAAPDSPAFFTAREVVADADTLRAALGFDRINIWGGSFGTRLAYYYVASHPDRVRAVIYDGAVPPDQPMLLTASAAADSALRRLYRRCAEEAACRHRFPRGIDDVFRVSASFSRRRAVPVYEPARDHQVVRRTTAADVLESIRAALYVPTLAAAVPLAVDRLAQGEPAPVVALSVEVALSVGTTQALGAMLAIMCSEETPRVNSASRRILPVSPVFGVAYAETFLDYCRDWPSAPVQYPDAPRGGLGTPALVISGASDPVSPSWRGTQLAAHHVRATEMVVAAGAHVNSARGCVPHLLAEFLAQPDRPLETSCAARGGPPPVALSGAGPVSVW